MWLRYPSNQGEGRLGLIQVVVEYLCLVCLVGVVSGADFNETNKHGEGTAAWSGRYYEAPDLRGAPRILDDLTFKFRSLQHRSLWCMLLVDLGHPFDLLNGGELCIHLSRLSEDLTLKVEIRDLHSEHRVDRGAYRRVRPQSGEETIIRLQGKEILDGLHPFGWQRTSLWPNWSAFSTSASRSRAGTTRHRRENFGSIASCISHLVAPRGTSPFPLTECGALNTRPRTRPRRLRGDLKQVLLIVIRTTPRHVD